ncbi:MAG: hypothetical protein JNJ54_25665 [Myxococcaceae bacterium]|nr:hypothetical protein [Myxococcaceae bacterium]
MAAKKPKTLETDDDVKAAVDELLGAFAAPEGVEPDDSGFGEAGEAKLDDGDARPRGAPSAEIDALWGGKKKR